MRLRSLFVVVILVVSTTAAIAQSPTPPVPTGGSIRAQAVTYTHNGTTLEGYVAYPAGASAQRKAPLVVVIHDWDGLGEYEMRRCRELAALGYVAFAADIYGKGVRPTTMQDCAAQATKYRSDRPLMRARARAALDHARTLPEVNAQQASAIGYCFGGGVALELARSGADLRAVACFHGNLDTPNPADAANIRARVLVLHGAIDPYVPAEQVAAFHKEMNEARVDYQFVAYSGTVHSFTIPEAGNDPAAGAAYNAVSDRRSWSALQTFLAE